MFAEYELCIIEESGQEKVEKIATWRCEHLVHPYPRIEQKVYALITDVFDRSVPFLTDYLYRLLKDLEVGKWKSAKFKADSHQNQQLILRRQFPMLLAFMLQLFRTVVMGAIDKRNRHLLNFLF